MVRHPRGIHMLMVSPISPMLSLEAATHQQTNITSLEAAIHTYIRKKNTF